MKRVPAVEVSVFRRLRSIRFQTRPRPHFSRPGLHVHPPPWRLLLLETVIPWSKWQRSGNPEQRQRLNILASTTWKQYQYPSWNDHQNWKVMHGDWSITETWLVDWHTFHLYSLLQKISMWRHYYHFNCRKKNPTQLPFSFLTLIFSYLLKRSVS